MKLTTLFVLLCLLIIILELADAGKSKKKKKKHSSKKQDHKNDKKGKDDKHKDKGKGGKDKGEKKDAKEGKKGGKGTKGDETGGEDNNKDGGDGGMGIDADDPAAPDMPKDIKAGRKLEKRFLTVLYALANETSESYVNATIAAHTLLRDLNEENFNLAQAFAFVPEFMTTDVPNQFMELLNVVRKYLSKGDYDLDSAFKVLGEWTEGLIENTGQSQMKMSSFITYWSGIFTSFKKYYRSSIDDLFQHIEF